MNINDFKPCKGDTIRYAHPFRATRVEGDDSLPKAMPWAVMLRPYKAFNVMLMEVVNPLPTQNSEEPVFFSILLLVTPIALIAQIADSNKSSVQEQTTDSYDRIDRRIAGQQAAENDISRSRWLAGGTAKGVALGLIGTGGITLTASLTSPHPSKESRLLLWNQNPTYTKRFLRNTSQNLENGELNMHFGVV